MKCKDCIYDKMPDEERPMCCAWIHARGLDMVCEYFERARE